MQFGYVTLFAAALPMAALMALANNLVELRTDAWKILTQHRRPVAQASDDIGAWHQVLGAISLLSLYLAISRYISLYLGRCSARSRSSPS